MKRQFLTLFILVILLLSSVSIIAIAQVDIWAPWHTKQEKIEMWKTLWDNTSDTEYLPIGKTYSGNDIWMFTAGNDTGPRILFDGEMHGNEDRGSELLYLMANWLLESNDSRATTILTETSIMFIPVLNDQDIRGNGNTEISQYGVDLNRNFETGWWLANPDGTNYAGPSPLSEPETQVLRQVFETYNPTFYVNMHCGAGQYAAHYSGSNTTLTNKAITRTQEICNEMGITPYRNPSFGSEGYAIGDAVSLGVQSAWLIETVGIDQPETHAWRHLPEDYDQLVNIYFPKCLAILIAMCEVSGSYTTSNPPPEPPPTTDPTPQPSPTINPPPTPSTTPQQIAPPFTTTTKQPSTPAKTQPIQETPPNPQPSPEPEITPTPSTTPPATQQKSTTPSEEALMSTGIALALFLTMITLLVSRSKKSTQYLSTIILRYFTLIDKKSNTTHLLATNLRRSPKLNNTIKTVENKLRKFRQILIPATNQNQN
jgi:hypothetical protein